MKILFSAVFVAGVFVSGLANADVIAERRAMMKEINGPSVGVLVKTAKGEMAYDPAAVLAAFQNMRTGTEGFVDLFPEGSETGGDTVASPKIWEDMDGFKAKFAAFQAELDAAIAAAPQDKEAFLPLLDKIGGTCGACHEMYRLKKQ